MDTGENIATVAMKLAITNVVKRYSGVAQQKNGFWLMEQALKGTLTPEFWIAEFEKDSPSKGREIYDEMVQWYAKTNIQQHEETALEEQAKQIRKEAKEKIQGLRNQFLQAETTVMQDKHEEKTTEKLLENPDYKALIKEKRDYEEFLRRAQKEPNNPAYRKENVDKVTAELAETNRKLEAF